MTRRRMIANLVALALVGGAGMAALWTMQRFEANRVEAGRGAVNDGVAIGGPFTLTDQDGARVSDAKFRGRFMLVFFGYVYCPDVCPTGLYNATQALTALGRDAERIAPVFITVDPARDTPGALRTYLANFHPSFVGLTGSAAETDAAAKAYRAYHAKTSDEGNGHYLIAHSAYLYLMGPDGAFLTHLRHDDAPERMAAMLRKHIKP